MAQAMQHAQQQGWGVLAQPFAAGGVLAGNLWGQVLERLTGLVNLQVPAGTFDPGAGIGMPVTQPSKPSR